MLNETQHGNGFTRAVSVKDSANSYGDGRTIGFNPSTGIVPWREEKSEDDALTRIRDFKRIMAKTSQRLLEWKVFSESYSQVCATSATDGQMAKRPRWCSTLTAPVRSWPTWIGTRTARAARTAGA
jgi:hypothetical protein